MYKLIVPCLAAAGLLSFSACSTVNGEKTPAAATTTSSSQTTQAPPVTTTTTETHPNN